MDKEGTKDGMQMKLALLFSAKYRACRAAQHTHAVIHGNIHVHTRAQISRFGSHG